MRFDVKDTLENEVMTIPQVGKDLGISDSLVYRYVVDEVLVDSVKIGNSHVVDREDLEVIQLRHQNRRPRKVNKWKKYAKT